MTTLTNSLAFRCVACVVGLVVRLIHLPMIALLCPLGASVGETPTINVFGMLPLCVVAWFGGRNWLTTKQWKLFSSGNDTFNNQIWMLKESLELIVSWNSGCYFIGWLWGFINRFGPHFSAGVSLDIASQWANAGETILHQLWLALILFVVQIAAFTLYFFVFEHADMKTVKMLKDIDEAKR